MSRKNNHSEKILKILGQKKAISVSELKQLGDKTPADKYSITRSIKALQKGGLVELVSSPQNDYARLTKAGQAKLNSIRLEGEDALVSRSWDGFWRIVIIDIPEERKSEREALRYLLKKANFACVKNTVWISPLPYENLFTNIKKDLGLSSELMIIVTDKLDPETHAAFLEAMRG